MSHTGVGAGDAPGEAPLGFLVGVAMAGTGAKKIATNRIMTAIIECLRNIRAMYTGFARGHQHPGRRPRLNTNARSSVANCNSMRLALRLNIPAGATS
jgi:hypothetical protein